MSNEEQIEFIKTEYPSIGLKGVSQKLHIGMIKLHKIIKENNLILSKRINMNDFYNIEMKEISYFLGILWSDGHVSKNNNMVNIECLAEDMLFYSKILNKFGNWCYSNRKQRNNDKLQINAYICDKYFHKFFVDNDYLEKSIKSPQKIISIIPEELKSYFLLGIIDGDGCFYYNQKNYTRQFVISGTFIQDWSIFEDIFKIIGVKKYKIERYKNNKSSYSQIRITNKNDIKLIGNFLYKTIETDSIGLERKYLKYKEIIK